MSQSIYNFVQNDSLHDARRLEDGDRIMVGKTIMEFQVAQVD